MNLWGGQGALCAPGAQNQRGGLISIKNLNKKKTALNETTLTELPVQSEGHTWHIPEGDLLLQYQVG